MQTIRTDSNLYRLWNLVIAVLVVCSCLAIPYQLAFSHRVHLFSSLALYLIDLVFLLDIYFSLKTRFRRDGLDVTDAGEIRRYYTRTRLPVDLLAALPFDILLLGWRDAVWGGVSIVLVIRLTRLLRITRLFRLLKSWESQSWSNAGYLRITRLLVVVLFSMHWVACVWFLIPHTQGFPPGSWTEHAGIETAATSTQYIRSLYWAVVTMTTVGYGDITPKHDTELVFAMLVILMGASVYAYVIANVASLLSNLDAAKVTFWNRVEGVNQYLRSRGVSSELNEHVRAYYDYTWSRYRGVNERELFADLPAPLRLEITLELAAELVETVPLFAHCGPALRNVLLMALKPQVFAPGGCIVSEGEAGHEIYFISRGRAEITSQERQRTHGTLQSGDYFGHLSLMLGEVRTASVKALEFCDVFVLTGADFSRIKNEHAEFREVIKKVSKERSAKLSELMLDGIFL